MIKISPSFGEGEPATRKELKELWKDGLYVPKEAEKAVSYYEIKRREVLRDTSMGDEEKAELVEYYDRMRTIRTVEDEAVYEDYVRRHHPHVMEVNFLESVSKALGRLIAKEQYVLSPNTVFLAPEENPVAGKTFRCTVKGVTFYDKDRIKSRHDLDLVEFDRPDIIHRGAVYMDRNSGAVRVAVIPEGMHIKKPDAHVKSTVNVPAIEVEMLTALANLSATVAYEPRAYEGGRLSQRGEHRGDPTKLELEKEIPSTLSYRRREIDNLGQLPDAIEELVNAWDAREQQELKRAGGGDIVLRIYGTSGAADAKQYTFFGAASTQNIATLSYHASYAFGQHQNALVTFEHAWRPPELDGADPGAPHAPHTRRLRGAVVLAVGNTVPEREREDIMRLWRKRKRGLEPDEQERLGAFLERYGLSNEVEAELFVAPGIHYKDGRFVPGAGAGPEHVYTR